MTDKSKKQKTTNPTHPQVRPEDDEEVVRR